MSAPEFWVFRVLADKAACRELHGVGHPQIDEWNRRIASGDICYVSGELCEPVEVFDGVDAQSDARDRMASEVSRNPGRTYKVVMSAELP